MHPVEATTVSSRSTYSVCHDYVCEYRSVFPGYCDQDEAWQHCIVSCGLCNVGDDTCWYPPDITFQRCCGGADDGHPDCFNEGSDFTFERCCALPPAAEPDTVACPAGAPPCPSMTQPVFGQPQPLPECAGAGDATECCCAGAAPPGLGGGGGH